MDKQNQPLPQRLDGVIVPPDQSAATPELRADLPAQLLDPPVSRWRRWRKPALIAVAAIVPVIMLFLGTRLLLATRKVITRNTGAGAPALLGRVDPTKLRGEGDGRVNILLLGIGGPGHEGANLSDTMMVMSIDPRTKDVAMLGLPRDLYVPIPGYGSAKINAAHAYGETQRYPGGGPALAKATVTKILDLPVHYYARIDFTGFKRAVDAVGGVDVVVEKALYDSEYPDERNPKRSKTFSLAAGRQHLDGATALKYVRCRKGNCGGDFGRAARQQQVLLALREKAISLKTLSNPSKLAELISIVGASAQTDLQLHEIRKLADIARRVDPKKVQTKVLDTAPGGLLMFGNIAGAGSIEIPRAGVGNFSQIQAFVHSFFADSYIKEERASIAIQNGSGRSGVAASVTALLKAYNYHVVETVTAKAPKPTTVIYDYSKGKKPYTLRYLERRFRVQAQRLPRATGNEADIVLIIGADYKPSYGATP